MLTATATYLDRFLPSSFHEPLQWALDLRYVGPLLRLPRSFLAEFERDWLNWSSIGLGLIAVFVLLRVLSSRQESAASIESDDSIQPVPGNLRWRSLSPSSHVDVLSMQEWRERVFRREDRPRSVMQGGVAAPPCSTA